MNPLQLMRTGGMHQSVKDEAERKKRRKKKAGMNAKQSANAKLDEYRKEKLQGNTVPMPEYDTDEVKKAFLFSNLRFSDIKLTNIEDFIFLGSGSYRE